MRWLIAIFVLVFYGVNSFAEDRLFILEGHKVQGGLMWGQASEGTHITLDGKDIKVGPKGYFVFGVGRDAPSQSELRITYPDGMSVIHAIKIARRDFDIERVNGLPPKTVTMPESWQKRRTNERAKVAEGRKFVTNDLFWRDDFMRPAKGRFSGFYGSQRILNGQPRSPHYGLDIAAPVGTPVVAPASGKVRLAAADFLLEGGIIIIDHGFGVTSTLFHMDSVLVAEGEAVTKGQQIGTIGAKGRANGPHVDWRLNWKNIRLDPGLMIGLDRLK